MSEDMVGNGVVANRRQRVAMVVANDVSVDTRVRKTAETVAALGYDVTVFGVTPGARTEEVLGHADIVRLHVKSTLSDSRIRLPIPSFKFRDREAFVTTRSKVKIAERELNAKKARLQADQSTSVGQRLLLKFVVGRRKVNGFHRRLTDRRWAHTQQSTGGRWKRAWMLNARIRRSWKTLLPETGDWELAVGVALDKFDADIIHAHDVHLLGVAARACDRAAARRERPALIYDAHEFIPGLDGIPARLTAGYTSLEREYIGDADQIITVSPLLAEWLKRDHDPQRPVRVVLNTPAVAWNVPDADRNTELSIRAAAGLGDDAEIVVYSGGYNSGRGVVTLIEAMQWLPATHLVLVAQGVNGYLAPLLAAADSVGYRDRIHLVPFVEPYEVPSYLSSADVGVHPMLHAPNHEVALPNKFFEYLHARVPIVVSDVASMASMVTEHGVGEWFEALDAAGLARTIRRVLDDSDTYRSKITDDLLARFSWERQGEVLAEVYAQFAAPVAHTATPSDLHRRLSADGVNVFIGPANFAGQASLWADSLRQADPSIEVSSWAIERKGKLNFPVDHRIAPDAWRSFTWQVKQLQRIPQFSHALLEAGLGALGTLNGGNFDDDLPFLAAQKITPGVVFHGSEIRRPSRHVQLERWSPFTDASADLTLALEKRTLDVEQRLERFTGQVFVTTVDLLDYVPAAAWLPTVVDVAAWESKSPVLDRARPVVVHAPTNRLIKGTDWIEPIMIQLDEAGLIEYRAVSGVTPEEMRDLVLESDIVVDQFAIGDYGVTSVQALAAGRVVVAHVDDRCRSRVPLPVPIIEADPESFEAVLRSLLEDRQAAREIAASGVAFADMFHNGAASARQLLSWVDGQTPSRIPHV